MFAAKDFEISERRRWNDRLLVFAIVLGFMLAMLGFLLAFLWVPMVNGAELAVPQMVDDVMVTHQQLLSQKIFFFHMPVAIVSFGSLVFSAFFAMRFLLTRDQHFDLCSRVAMEIALLFVVLTMITGDLWTRFEWGVWWTWDPRLTTYLILMLVAIAYFVLRAAVEDAERRAIFSAAMSIIALADVPICFLITRVVPSSVHPVVTREGGMTPDMALVVVIVLAGMALIAFALYQLRYRQLSFVERLAIIKERVEDRR